MQNARDYLTTVYLDWVNNYLTMGVFAEHHGLTFSQAADLIKLAKEIHNSKHPDA